MPRPRFYKLTDERRRAVLDTAAAEFAAHGYHDASINRVQAKLKVSKGAFYYWFDDKEDLFIETISSRLADMSSSVGGILQGAVQPGRYWPQVEDGIRGVFRYALAHPQSIALIKAASALPPDTSPRMAALWQRGTDAIARIIEEGQQRELIRTDLPSSLLSNLTFAVGEACDRHVLSQPDLETIDVDAWVALYLDLLRRMLRR
ncbi:MAG: TetR/AcrR family transcriptional regulator [Myxococcota bacterium]